MPISLKVLRRAENVELPLGALAAITELRAQLSELELQQIEAARARGASWEEIAGALGITRQALRQRLQARAREDAAEAGDAPPR